MSQMPVTISIHGIRKVFGTNPALDGVTLELSSGFMHGVIGPEGAGKTTLLRIILGLIKPTEGTVEFQRGSERIDFETIRPSVAYMPQTQSLYPDL
jgi:ABC-2 type transport system ATP-binding protein